MITPRHPQNRSAEFSQKFAKTAWALFICLTVSSTAIAAGKYNYTQSNPGAHPFGDDDEVASEGIGIGGTGYHPGQGQGATPGDGNGIGGTGQQATNDGTGGIGGTGIIGAITGYGSIFVNGYEVEIPDDMAVTIKDGQTTADKLRIGQIVEIEAVGEGTHVNAASVHVRHELGGKIERIDQKNRTAIILGQKIEFPDKAGNTAKTGSLSFENIRIGDRVDVSGFRRADGTIEAIRIDAQADNEPDHLIGTLKKTGTSGPTVSGLSLSSDQVLDTTIEDGAEIRVVGQWRANSFRARRIRARARWRFSKRVRRLAIEGYARRTTRGGYAIGSHRLNRPGPVGQPQRIIYSGRFDARRRFILGNARAARLLKRRGRRIRALRRKFRQDATPEMREKWQAMPPKARKKARKRWLKRNERKRRLRRRKRRWNN